jgi:hypothetical protein
MVDGDVPKTAVSRNGTLLDDVVDIADFGGFPACTRRISPRTPELVTSSVSESDIKLDGRRLLAWLDKLAYIGAGRGGAVCTHGDDPVLGCAHRLCLIASTAIRSTI